MLSCKTTIQCWVFLLATLQSVQAVINVKRCADDQRIVKGITELKTSSGISVNMTRLGCPDVPDLPLPAQHRSFKARQTGCTLPAHQCYCNTGCVSTQCTPPRGGNIVVNDCNLLAQDLLRAVASNNPILIQPFETLVIAHGTCNAMFLNFANQQAQLCLETWALAEENVLLQTCGGDAFGACLGPGGAGSGGTYEVTQDFNSFNTPTLGTPTVFNRR